MIFYILLYFLIFSIIHTGNHKLTERAKSVVAFLVLFVVTAGRYDVGRDQLEYIDVIRNPAKIESYAKEPLSWLLLRMSSEMLWIFFIISSFLILYLFWSTIRKYSSIWSVSVLCFIAIPLFWFGSLSVIRQALAMGVIFYANRFICERKLLLYLLFCVVAMSFHNTAVVAIVFYPISRISLLRIGSGFLFAGVLVSYYSVEVILSRYFPMYLKYFQLGYGDNAGGQTVLYLFILILGVALLCRKRLLELNKQNGFYLNMLLVGTTWHFLANDLGHIGSRVSSFFYVFTLLLIPDIINVINRLFRQKILRFAYVLIFGIFIVSLLVGMRSEYGSSFIPYRFVLFEKNI